MSDGLFVIAAGAVEVARRDHVVHRMGPGETIGAVGFISQKAEPGDGHGADGRARAVAGGGEPARSPRGSSRTGHRRSRRWRRGRGPILRLEMDTDDAAEMAHPEVFTARLRHFLSRLAA